MGKQSLLDTMNDKISAFEKELNNGLALSEAEATKLERIITNLGIAGNLTEEEMKPFIDRVNVLKEHQQPNERFIQNVSPKSASVPEIDKIKKLSKKAKLKIAAIATAAAVAIGGGAFALNKNQSNDEPLVAEAVEEQNADVMDEFYQELSKDITLSMNDQISKGLVVTEENKDTLAKKYTEYYLLNQMDELTDEQWANIFPNSTITSEDIMKSKEYFEDIDERRVTVCSSDMYLDYNLMFEGEDAKLLNNAALALDKVKTTSGSEKTEAISNFKSYVSEVLISEDSEIKYSPRALDTFRDVYFQAFDILTNGNEIDNEWQHKVNTMIGLCSTNQTIEGVQDSNIQSLQSDYQLYQADKLQIRLENGWNYALNHKLNENNDIEKISEYVADNIDLSLYRELPDYETTLKDMFLSNEGSKSIDDSGISNGQGGTISKSDMNRVGASDRATYEQKIVEETKAQEDASKTTVDIEGNKVDPEKANYYTQLGASDYNAGIYDESKVPSQYLVSYRNGMKIAKEAIEDAKKNSSEINTYEPVNNGGSEVTESKVEITPYTMNDSIVTTEEFVPVDDSQSIITESEVETIDFVPITSYYSLEDNDLQQLKEFRNYLTEIVESDVETYDYADEPTSKSL